jgi:DNA polymerase III subunit gamma/tau
MAYQVLARKWRPKQFEEVIGQEHVTRALQNSLKNNTLAHAYLFSGTRGVGKTSIARLFAKAIRCQNPKKDLNPCLECSSCVDIEQTQSLDYLEIDGASHNSVDDMRNLIENVSFLPTSGTHKIYVIDEVHMLSTSAFNALLKTLEEPPAHVIFLLATTDPQKLLGTVLSRVQRFDFRHVSVDTLEKHIETISKKEGLSFESTDLIRELAELGAGSVRDMLSIWDQLLSLSLDKKIKSKTFYEALGLASASEMKTLIQGILQEDSLSVVKLYEKLIYQNIDVKKLTEQILDHLFKLIQSLDQGQTETSLSGVSFSEIFWIYETILKDSDWALKSAHPHKAMALVLQKICWRRKELKKDSVKPQTISAKVEIPKPAVTVSKLPSFESFLEFLDAKSPTIKSHLEQGGLIKPVQFQHPRLIVEYGLPKESEIAKEYLEDREIYLKLVQAVSEFYQVNKEDVSFSIRLLDKDERIRLDFESYEEKEKRNHERNQDQKKERLLNNPVLKEAEKIFKSKIDKVIIKD